MGERDQGERLTAPQVAARLGIKPDTWWSYVNRGGHAPGPDGREELSNKPWWYASTIEAWQATRRGRGRRRSSTD